MEGVFGGKRRQVIEERQVASCVQLRQARQEQLAEQTREHTHREEEVRPALNPAIALRRDAAARYDAMDMRVMIQVLPPRVQHAGDADRGTEMLGVRGDGGQRLGCRREQQAVDPGLVLVSDGADRGRRYSQISSRPSCSGDLW